MEAYNFLENHEYFSTKRVFEHHTVYVFRKQLENNQKRFGTIQMPTTTNGEFNYYFSNEEQMEPWFEELLKTCEQKANHLFRIKKVIEGKMD